MLPYCSIDPAIADIIAQPESPENKNLKDLVTKLIKRITNRHIIIDPLSGSVDGDDFGPVFLEQLKDACPNWYIRKKKPKNDYLSVNEYFRQNDCCLGPQQRHLLAALLDSEIDVVYMLRQTKEYFCHLFESRVCGSLQAFLLAEVQKKAIVFSIEEESGELKVVLQGGLSAAEQCAFLFSGKEREDTRKGVCISLNLHAQKQATFIEKSLKPFAEMFQDIFWLEPHLFSPFGRESRYDRFGDGEAILTLTDNELGVCRMLLDLYESGGAPKLHIVSSDEKMRKIEKNGKGFLEKKDKICNKEVLKSLYNTRSEKVAEQLKVGAGAVACHFLKKNMNENLKWHDRFIVFMTRAIKPNQPHFAGLVFSAPLMVNNDRLGPGLCGFRCPADEDEAWPENIAQMLALADRQAQKKPMGAHEIP